MFESINQNKNTKEEKPSKNTSINIPESPTIQGVESQVFKNRTDTIFYSENKNGYISELSENLKGNIQYEKLMMSHDAMHPIIQAKLESLGVKTTRVTSLENEIIILAFSLSDDTIKNDFGIDGSNLISTTKQIIKDQLSIHIKDYKINEEKYLEYEKTLQKIFIQSSILSQKIINNSAGKFFANSITQAYESMKSNSQNLEPNEVINFETRSFSEFDSELFNEVANEVKILNNSLNKLQNLKELNTIEDILNPN